MSEKTVVEKLYVRPGYQVAVLNAPESYAPMLAQFPPDVSVADSLDGTFDFIQYFATARADLEQQGPKLRDALKPAGLLWVGYPKGKSIPTDLKREIVAEALAGASLRPVAQIAIDDVWSALRFKHR